MKPIPTAQLPLRQPPPGGRVLRYAFAVVAVAAGSGLRLALTAWVGPGLPTYITFYPAVMAAAVLGGIGPGLVATVLTGLVSAYWILQPVGQFAIASPVDRLGVALFILMGLFMSVLAESYRRNRQKAAAQERELALREGREALQRQAELIDPVRAEIIAQEMLRVVRGRSAATPVAPMGNWVRRLPTAIGVAVAVIGAMVLLGWMLGAEWLKRVVPGLPTMKFNTGLCFLLVGLALALRERRGLRVAFAVMACAVAGLTMAEYATGWDFGIDQVWFHELPDAHTIYPGRMVPATALCFLMSGAALLSLWSRRSRWAQQSLAVLTGVLGMVGLLGYAYGVEAMYRFAGHSSMALHTAAAFTLLTVGLVFARTDGLAPLLMAKTPGSHAARRFLPAAIPVTLFIGWLHVILDRHHVVSPEVGDCLVVIVLVLSIVSLVLWTARVLNRSDALRREIEGQLRDQVELMNLANEGLIVREMDGAIRSWNRGAEALYGWSAAEALGHPIHTLLKTGGVDLAALAAQLERTGHWEGEYVQTARDGRRIAVESRKTLTRTAEGRVLILENNRDITVRKKAEMILKSVNDGLSVANEELRASRVAALNLMKDAVAARQETERAGASLQASEQRIQQALRVSHSFTFEWDPSTDTVLRSASCGPILGLAGDEAVNDIGQRYFERIPPDDRVRFTQMLGNLTPAAASYTTEYRVVRPDGSTVVLEEVGQASFDAAGQLIRLVGVTADITARKQAEAEARHLHEIVAQEKDRLSALVNSITDEIWFADAAGQFTLVNPAGNREFALSTAGGTDVRDLAASLEVLRPDGSLRPVEEAPPLRALRGEVVQNHEELIRTPAMGELRWRQVSAAPVRDSSGTIIGSVAVVRDITERKRAEDALRESEQRLALAASGTRIGIFDRNLITDEIKATEQNVRLLGLRTTTTTTTTTTLSQEYPYREWAERVHPEDLPRVEAEMKRCMDEHAPFDAEYRVVWLDGSTHWIAARGVFRYDGQKTPTRLLGILMDITARKHAEAALLRSEEQLQRAQEIAHLGSWELDLVANRLSWSDEVYRLFGLQPQEFSATYEAFLERIHPDDRAKVDEAYSGSLRENRETYEVEHRIVRKDTGEIRIVHERCQHFHDATGKIVRSGGMVHDITDRKQAEAARRQRMEDALHLSEQEFRFLAESVPQIVWATRPDGLNIYFNQQWVDYTGMTLEDSYGHGWNTPFHPDDKQRAWEAWQRATQHNERYSVESRLRRHDGVYRWWLIRGEPMRGANGEILKWFGTCTDIEELKRAEAVMHEANDLLEQRVTERTAALRASEERLRRIAQAGRIGFFEWNASRDTYYWSPEHYEIFGYEPGSPIKWERWLASLHPDDRQRVAQDASRLREQGRPGEQGQLHKDQYRFVRADGAVRWLESEVSVETVGGEAIVRGAVRDVTERKRAEEELARTKTMMESLLTQAPVGIAYFDRELRYVLINDQLAALNGLPVAAHLGRRVGDLMPTLLPAVQEVTDRILATGQPVKDHEFSGETAAQPGVTRYWNESWYPVRDGAVAIIGFGAVVEEITARKRAEQALQKAYAEAEEGRRLLAALMEHVPEGITIADAPGVNIRMVSRYGQEVLGGRHDQMTAGEVAQRWTVYQADGVTPLPTEDLPLVRAIQRGETVQNAELVQVNEHGRRLSLLCNAAPILDGAGKIVGGIVAWRDVGELEMIQDALRASERLYRGIGESIDYGIWVCDAQGRNTYASESFLKLVGITQEQCSGLQWGDVLHPDDVEATIAAWLQCVETGGPWYREHRYRGADGQWHPILACGVAVRNEQGEVSAWAGINLDISRLKQTEEELRVSLHEKEVLLKEVHHRVKNNMQVLASLVNLQADHVDDPATRDVFNDFRDQVRTMALVHENLYQSESLARIDFAEFARGLTRNLARSHGRGNSDLRLTLDTEPVTLPVESAVPCGLILNELVTNAYKHAFRDRKSGEIAVGVHVDSAGRVCLSVRDDGVGLPTGVDWRQSPTLGLRLVQMLARQVHGELDLRADNGAAFRLTFTPPRPGDSKEEAHA